MEYSLYYAHRDYRDIYFFDRRLGVLITEALIRMNHIKWIAEHIPTYLWVARGLLVVFRGAREDHKSEFNYLIKIIRLFEAE